MPTGHVFIATSVDGFIARDDGRIDWLPESPEDHGYDAFMASMDGVILGRATFDTVLGFSPWPFTKPVIVVSRTPAALRVPPGADVQVAASPEEALALADRAGWRRAYIDGGQLIQSFLARRLIADLIVTRIPVLLGAGRPLFGPLPADLPLRHVSTTSYPSGLVQSKYAVDA
jgi:dihydrofolate reductase